MIQGREARPFNQERKSALFPLRFIVDRPGGRRLLEQQPTSALETAISRVQASHPPINLLSDGLHARYK